MTEDEKAPEAENPEWKRVDRLPLQDRMVEVVKLTKEAAESELAAARRKLRKLRYGS